eukprot:scaffold12949_cov67-Isochrysis_galbana.AAC.1
MASCMMNRSSRRSCASTSARRSASATRAASTSSAVACSSRRRCSNRRGRASSHRRWLSASSRFAATTHAYGTSVTSSPRLMTLLPSSPCTIAAPARSPSGLPLSPSRRSAPPPPSALPSATPPSSPILFWARLTACSVPSPRPRRRARWTAQGSCSALEDRSSLTSSSAAKHDRPPFAAAAPPAAVAPPALAPPAAPPLADPPRPVAVGLGSSAPASSHPPLSPM